MPRSQPVSSGLARRAHLLIVSFLQVLMVTELVVLIVQQQWLHAFLVTGIMVVTLLPIILRNRVPIKVPSEIQILVLLSTAVGFQASAAV